MPAPAVSVIVPTFQEATNLPTLHRRLTEALADHVWELIVVDDDSPDRTWEVAASLGPPTRVLRRTVERGLSSAVVAGFNMAAHPHVVVMDADLQHDPADLPKLLAPLSDPSVDVAVGSRFVQGGGAPGLSRWREWASRATVLGLRALTGVRLADPLSGLFAARTTQVRAALPRVRAEGFKILLDLLLAWPHTPHVVEVPATLAPRHSGESKLDARVALALLRTVWAHRMEASRHGG